MLNRSASRIISIHIIMEMVFMLVLCVGVMNIHVGTVSEYSLCMNIHVGPVCRLAAACGVWQSTVMNIHVVNVYEYSCWFCV